jgi:ABC-type multidrug transport system ATPase subunit
LDARDVTVRAKGKEILTPTSLTIGPGEMAAIIGESGAGKTTLLKAIAGVSRISEGQITINGEAIATRLTDIGYVPQDDVVHRLLTVSEALNYAARLRLPQDASDEEIAEAVTRVLRELSLEGNADQLIESLSGGQRKRTAVATELLARPSLLFLDEPTTGMDPGLESKMMLLFRELADESRALVLTTHATKNLALCDRVLVMGRGGVMTFDGPPKEALEFFAVDTYDGIYDTLEAIQSSEWRRRFQKSREGGLGQAARQPATAEPQVREPSRAVAALPQAVMLAGRYAKLLRRDRRNLLLLVGQAPVLGIAAVGLFRSGLFNRVGGDAAGAIELLFLMGLTTIWLGSVDAAREIIKERSVLEREYAVGLRLTAYLISKVAVLWALVALQVVLNVGVLLIFRPLDEPASVYFAVFALLIVTGFAAVGMGLLISTLANSEDQSMSLLPLALIPQILFAGTIVTVARMAQPAKTISYVITSQWSLAGLGTQLGMNGRIATDPQFARVNPFGTHFFDVPLAWSLLVQAGFFVAFIAIVSVLLHRRLRAIAR